MMEIILGFIITGILSILILAISYYISVLSKKDSIKLLPYECGYDPYIDSKEKAIAKFYLVGILYLLFDLELSYLIPIITVWGYINYNIVNLIVIFIILIVGFIYEYKADVVHNSQLK